MLKLASLYRESRQAKALQVFPSPEPTVSPELSKQSFVLNMRMQFVFLSSIRECNVFLRLPLTISTVTINMIKSILHSVRS